jgi:plasmid stabilization system protein ParE
MIYKVNWSGKAKTTYLKTIQYLSDHWTSREVENFQNRVSEVIEKISENPQLYQSSQKGLTFRCVVTKHISLFYDVTDDRTELLIFWDNRQNPNRLKY